jgi:transposase-like protein
MKYQIRNRTKIEDISYALNLYFTGLSLRNTAKALSRFAHRSHTSIRDWIQKYKPKRLFCREANIAVYNR